MRYDAYRLPGVRWRWVGVGKSPEPDHWPNAVSIEGVRVETIRGKGWGIGRAYYKCPVCGQTRTKLYSASNSQAEADAASMRASQGQGISQGQDRDGGGAERTYGAGMQRVACSQHWSEGKIREDDALLAEAHAARYERSRRYRPLHHEYLQRAAEIRASL